MNVRLISEEAGAELVVLSLTRASNIFTPNGLMRFWKQRNPLITNAGFTLVSILPALHLTLYQGSGWK